MQPVDVLGGVDGGQDGELVEARGLLDDEPGAVGVLVELAHDVEHLVLGRAGRQVAAHAADADLGAVAVLGPDVPVAARVVADEHRAEAGDDAVLGQRGHAEAQLLLDGAEDRLAVQGRRCHPLILSRAAWPAARSPGRRARHPPRVRTRTFSPTGERLWGRAEGSRTGRES